MLEAQLLSCIAETGFTESSAPSWHPAWCLRSFKPFFPNGAQQGAFVPEMAVKRWCCATDGMRDRSQRYVEVATL